MGVHHVGTRVDADRWLLYLVHRAMDGHHLHGPLWCGIHAA